MIRGGVKILALSRSAEGGAEEQEHVGAPVRIHIARSNERPSKGVLETESSPAAEGRERKREKSP